MGLRSQRSHSPGARGQRQPKESVVEVQIESVTSLGVSLNNRAGKGHTCPYCSGKRPDAQSSLLATRPDLCKYWDDPRDPADFLPNSHKKVWWKCEKDPTHRWEASPNNRVSNNSVCPHCRQSGGEFLIRQELTNLGVPFSTQCRFPNCRHKKPLAFDFAIHHPRFALIEFHGVQHYAPFEFFGGDKCLNSSFERDQIKREYCQEQGIPYLEIPYHLVYNIPAILKNFIDSLQEKTETPQPTAQ